MYVSMYVRVYVCMYVYVRVSVCKSMYGRMYVFLCMYIRLLFLSPFPFLFLPRSLARYHYDSHVHIFETNKEPSHRKELSGLALFVPRTHECINPGAISPSQRGPADGRGPLQRLLIISSRTDHKGGIDFG